MPHIWNDIWVVTKEELIPQYFAYDTLKKQIKRYEDKPYGIKRVQKACRNRPLLIDFKSLPVEIRESIGDPEKKDSILEHYYKIDLDAVEFYTTHKVGVRGTLSPDIQEKYIINASVLQSAILLKRDREIERLVKGMKRGDLLKSVSDDVNGFNDILRAKYEVEHTLPSHYRRFGDTLNKFVSDGYISLLNGQYNNTHAKKKTEPLQALLESMFVSQDHKPTPTEIAGQYSAFLDGYVEIINNETGEVYNPKEFSKLSESTIRKSLSKWESKIVTYNKRSGSRKDFLEEFIPHYDMEQPKYAGSIVSVDDRQPPFEYQENKRVWFYNAVDLGSECLTTWVYGKTKDGLIVEFYRQMVRNYAEWGLPLPAELECESALNSSFKETFLREGRMFRYVHIEANNPRGKRCERVWGGFRYDKEKKREGWQPRPFARRESNQISSKKIPLIPYENIIQNCLSDIQEHNNSPHSDTKRYPDKTRWEVFVENQHPNLKPINYNAFLHWLGYKTETSCNAGTIRLQGGRYWLGENGEICTGEKLLPLLKEIDGKELDIYWIDDNDGNVLKALIYMRGGDRCICEAIKKPVCTRATIEKTADGKSAEEITARYIATINGYISTRKKEIERVTVIDNRTPALNDKFQIRGIRNYERKQPEETEVLEEPEDFEFDLNAVQRSFKPSFVDTF